MNIILDYNKKGVKKMDFKKLSEKHSATKILMKGVDTTLINSIRRTVMNSVPTFAVEDVTIYENNSALFDEYLGHRLAMIPIKSDPKNSKKGDTVKFVLEKTGPGIVYSRDLKSTDPKIEVIDKNIPIAKLKKDQKIKLEADAVVGLGKEHSKWQPALITFKEVPKVSFDTKQLKDPKRIIAECPKGVLELKAGKIMVADPINADIDLLMKCADIVPAGTMTVGYDTDTYVVTVDNFGNHETLDIFLLAVESLREKTKGFRAELKKT
ncbi:MAG: DNA-directed RNA polymerase subunit D [Candidatus Diapherotrites archaeon]|nr:DNA-directed RNA polymerase subunit D [Candidatus Diapherotrites archaeon]